VSSGVDVTLAHGTLFKALPCTVGGTPHPPLLQLPAPAPTPAPVMRRLSCLSSSPFDAFRDSLTAMVPVALTLVICLRVGGRADTSSMASHTPVPILAADRGLIAKVATSPRFWLTMYSFGLCRTLTIGRLTLPGRLTCN